MHQIQVLAASNVIDVNEMDGAVEIGTPYMSRESTFTVAFSLLELRWRWRWRLLIS